MSTTSDVHALLQFFTFCEALKKLKRYEGSVFWRDYPIEDYESVADHTWRMGLILISIAPKLQQPLQLERALKMCLIHDIPEIIAGDPSPLGSDGTGKDSHWNNETVAASKYEREQVAATEIFAKAGPELGGELLALWEEFEANESFEAKVVMAVDKFEGKLQAMEYTCDIKVPEQHLEFTLTYGVGTFEVDPFLEELGEKLLQEIQENFDRHENL